MSLVNVAEHCLAPEPVSVRAARRVVRETVGDHVDPDTLDSLLLATSEVVTNAVEHGAPPIALVIECDDDRVRIEVRDASPLRPRPGCPEPTDVRGRGMRIVERLVDRWGVEEWADGKSVWMELRWA